MADWIYGIVAVMVFATVIQQILPEGTYQKYVRLFMGVLLIFAVISPVLSLFGLKDSARLSFEQEFFSSWISNITRWDRNTGEKSTSKDGWERTMLDQLSRRQENWMKEVLELTSQEYGFTCLNYQVEWNEAGDWPSGLTLWVTKAEDPKEDNFSVRPVEDVDHVYVNEQKVTQDPVGDFEEIQAESGAENAAIRYEKKNQEVYYEPSELRSLHQALQTVWQLDEEQILLYLQR